MLPSHLHLCSSLQEQQWCMLTDLPTPEQCTQSQPLHRPCCVRLLFYKIDSKWAQRHQYFDPSFKAERLAGDSNRGVFSPTTWKKTSCGLRWYVRSDDSFEFDNETFDIHILTDLFALQHISLFHHLWIYRDHLRVSICSPLKSSSSNRNTWRTR